MVNEDLVETVLNPLPCACGNPNPCYQNPPCTNLATHPGTLPNLGTPVMNNERDLISKLLRDGGAIVRASDCTAMEIAVARSEGRIYISTRGYGFLLRKPD